VSILAHPDWPILRPYLRIERYGRDTGRHGARVRLEVDRPADGILVRRILGIRMPCVGCGRPISPVRCRQGLNHMYYAPTCALDVTYRCARGRAAREEYRAVVEALEAWHRGGGAPPGEEELPW
jgi:hypothetical protein